MTEQKKITAILLVFSAFCIFMEAARMYRSFSLVYIFLPWNLFLAWVPYLLSLRFAKADMRGRKMPFMTTFLLWILFLPNAPYIITDLVHLRLRDPVPMWYDVLLVSSYAWLGLMLALLSVRNIHQKLMGLLSPVLLWCGILLVFLSSGYGIYVGRFLRWNSWDIFIRPRYILTYSLWELIHPIQHMRVVLVTVIIGLLLSFSYAMIHIINPQPGLKNK